MFNCWLFYPYTEISIERTDRQTFHGRNAIFAGRSQRALATTPLVPLTNPHRLLAFGGRNLVSSRRAPPENWPRKFDAGNFPWNQFQPSLLSFLCCILARWCLPLLLFVPCWLIRLRLKVDSVSHTRLVSIWSGGSAASAIEDDVRKNCPKESSSEERKKKL